jgi:tetratricopeptide (TPR) repeat protein
MRSLTFAAGIAALALPLYASNAATITLGGPFSQLCYEAALSGDDRDSSLEDCTRSLNEEPMGHTDRAATYVNRGILRMIRGNDAAADADFDAALALRHELPDAWLNKGFLRIREGNGREALPLLQEGISRNPQNVALAIFARGVAYEQMGEFNSAYKDLKRAHELQPHWSMPSEYLAHYQVVSR